MTAIPPQSSDVNVFPLIVKSVAYVVPVLLKFVHTPGYADVVRVPAAMGLQVRVGLVTASRHEDVVGVPSGQIRLIGVGCGFIGVPPELMVMLTDVLGDGSQFGVESVTVTGDARFGAKGAVVPTG